MAAPELTSALTTARTALFGTAVFSAAINCLMLTGPLYMLQIYDRVLASRSEATLLVLSGLVVFLYGLMGLLDHVRGRVFARVGASLQAALDARVFRALLTDARNPALRDRPATGLQDLASIQTLLAAPAMGALFDLPWTPLYIALLFALHPVLGWAGVLGGVLIFLLALLNRQATRGAEAEAIRRAAEAEQRTAITRRSVETVTALGMTAPLVALWQRERGAALSARMAVSDRGGGYGAATKSVRLLLQSAMLGLGAWLVLHDQLTAGAMIAGSILLGRALAPLEQTVGQWPLVERARVGWRALDDLLSRVPRPQAPLRLPSPEGRLDVRGLAVASPVTGREERTLLLRDVSFTLGPGEALAVIGPSASGKSTLARALVGFWPPVAGEIRLGGATLTQYDPDTLGRLIGYLPQEVVLFQGSVAQNIARFDPSASSEAIVSAAKAAGAHELILHLPQGYATEVHDGGGRLSGGQRQRIGLARAFFGDPVLLVLDEPNAALDEQGIIALEGAITRAKAGGRAVVLMSHRASALGACDRVLVLEAGRMRAEGPRDEIMRVHTRPAPLLLGPALRTAR